MDAGRQPESGLGFLIELQVQRRQCRAEAEGPWREQHVLHRGMISSDFEIAMLRTVPRLNFEPAKSRKLAIELRFSSAAIRGRLHTLRAPLDRRG